MALSTRAEPSCDFEIKWRVRLSANSPCGVDVFDCSLFSTMLSRQYIDQSTNLVELGEIPCIKPSEEQAGRGFCGQCLRPEAEF